VRGRGIGYDFVHTASDDSQKLVFVEGLTRERGQRIHVIDDRGFEDLLHGGSARCQAPAVRRLAPGGARRSPARARNGRVLNPGWDGCGPPRAFVDKGS